LQGLEFSMDRYKSISLLGYPNILLANLYALLIAVEHNKMLPKDTFIFTYSLNNIYFLLNLIRNPSSHYNHPYKLLVTRIGNMLKTSQHNFTIRKVRAHTNTVENVKADKLAKQGVVQPRIVETPFHLIGHQTL
jgi:hypothetical protein